MSWFCKIFGHRFHLLTDGSRVLDVRAGLPVVNLACVVFLCERCLHVRRFMDVKGCKP